MKSGLLARYADRPLPRYTSYPTAPHFSPMDSSVYGEWLAALPAGEPVSLYLHLPFCRSMCWYCGCHTTITARDESIARYLEALHREIGLGAKAMPNRHQARHVHFGGGTPTLMKPAQFVALVDALRSHFAIGAGSEGAIEIDPRTIEREMIVELAVGGITRASLGVQSFDPVVQKAINRVQSFEQTAAAAHGLRDAGVRAINFDLIYGLPHQTIDSCVDTVAQAMLLKPDRIAVFGYAHVPSFKLHQRKIDEAALADGAERHAQAEAIAGALVDAGYIRIGLDLFARPDDALAIAQMEGKLRRNFQGYTTDNCEPLVGFGASSIGRLPQGYVQNAVLIGDYQQRIAEGVPAVSKGGDRAHHVRLPSRLDAVCGSFGANPRHLLDSTRGLDRLIADGIARREQSVVSVTDEARPLVRVLAAAFDENLDAAPARHSRASDLRYPHLE